ncbi:MAG: hypothetical protein Q7T58_05180 [Methylotenera sp.]|nr:hypothetical protein [Methylotenera sp.]
MDCKSQKSIIVGRTGAGKSALLYQLTRSCEHIVKLSPHSLSLNFIASNKVIAFFEEAGVNLSPFYVLLWRHLLVVELLKDKFRIVNEDNQRKFIQNIKAALHKGDRYKDLALEYLENWGDKFWLTTEQRVHELTERVETSLKAGASFGIAEQKLSGEAARNLSSEQKKNVIEHGLDVVNKVQIRELDNMLIVLEQNVFDDSRNPYYITIDMLDEDWADERIKYKLIRALIDVVKRFRCLTNVKIILAIRQDLLHKVIYLEAAPGFQEEKYKSLYLNLGWDKKALTEIVETRIKSLVERRYTRKPVCFYDIFPAKVDHQNTLDYMLDRTFMRPRDIIVFINECLELAEGKNQITAEIVKDAELNYSKERLISLAYEWSLFLPYLNVTARLFYGLPTSFELGVLDEKYFTDKYDELMAEITDDTRDPITRQLSSIYQSGSNFQSIRNYIIREFYRIGLIGIKSSPNEPKKWSYLNNQTTLVASEVKSTSIVYIHPIFYRALGINLRPNKHAQ